MNFKRNRLLTIGLTNAPRRVGLEPADMLDLSNLERDSNDVRGPRRPMADACLCESGLSFLPDYRFFSKRPDFLGIERRVDRSCFLTFRAPDARNFEAAGFTFGFASMAEITAGVYVFCGEI